MATDVQTLAEAAFSGCGSGLSPLIGIELTLEATRVEAADSLPDGDLAVLPVELEIDGRSLGSLTLHAPLAGAASLARRMLGDAEPDKERALSPEELEAVGELLGLWAGALDAAVREHVNAEVRSRPLAWWRSAEPGSNAFPAGSHELAQSALVVPGGIAVPLCLRLAPALIPAASVATSERVDGKVLLLGLAGDAGESLARVLGTASFEVRSAPLDAPDRLAAIAAADWVLLAGEAAAVSAACRQLRLANSTWLKPAVVCMTGPTRERVLDALHDGASGVLCLPADADSTVLRVLRESRSSPRLRLRPDRPRSDGGTGAPDRRG